MDRRVFLISALAAAATPDSPQILTPQPAPDPELPGLGEASGDPDFDAWKAAFIKRAMTAGWSAELLDRELKDLKPEPRVVALDSRQPEFSKPVGDYIRGVVSDDRVEKGRAYLQDLAWLPAIEAQYGVPREILLGVWAMESAFGAVQGDFDVVQAVATLAAAGRRRGWAEAQLFAALRILSTTPIGRDRLKGSWAGAMGQTQFIPETYLTTAVDADGDGAKDIWGSSQDALASAANLLAKAGWARGQGWHREVVLPKDFDFSLAEGPRQPWAAWSALGMTTADGLPFRDADVAAPAGLILPAGAYGPALLALPNHFVIRKYNNSTSYALGVGLLADRFAGGVGLLAAWPYETGLSLADRTGAQEALAKLGYDPGAPDGIIGTNTRAALRAWQKSKGLPADGYLSADMVQRLRAETATLAAAPPL